MKKTIYKRYRAGRKRGGQHYIVNYGFLIPKWVVIKGKGLPERFEDVEMIKLDKKSLSMYSPSDILSEYRYKKFVKKEGLKTEKVEHPEYKYPAILTYKHPEAKERWFKTKTESDMGIALGYPEKSAKAQEEKIIKDIERKEVFPKIPKESDVLRYNPWEMSSEEIESAIKEKEKALKVTYPR